MLSPYEVQRAENVAANEAKLVELGLLPSGLASRPPTKVPKKAHKQRSVHHNVRRNNHGRTLRGIAKYGSVGGGARTKNLGIGAAGAPSPVPSAALEEIGALLPDPADLLGANECIAVDAYLESEGYDVKFGGEALLPDPEDLLEASQGIAVGPGDYDVEFGSQLETLLGGDPMGARGNRAAYTCAVCGMCPKKNHICGAGCYMQPKPTKQYACSKCGTWPKKGHLCLPGTHAICRSELKSVLRAANDLD